MFRCGLWCLARQKGCRKEEAPPLPGRGHCRSLRICYLLFAQWQQCYHDIFAAQNACANNPLPSFHHSRALNAPVMHLLHLHRTFSQFTSWPPKAQFSAAELGNASAVCFAWAYTPQQNRSSTPCFQWWGSTGLPSPGARTRETWGLRNQHGSDPENGHGPVPKMAPRAYLCELTGLRSQPYFYFIFSVLFVLWLH